MKKHLAAAWKKSLRALREHWIRKYHKPHAHVAKWVLGFDLFLLTLLGALVVFWIFSASILPAVLPPQAVEVGIKSPDSVKNGGEVVLTIPYSNRLGAVAANAELRVILPFDFTVTETVPDVAAGDRMLRFSLGDLAPGGGGLVTVRGLVYGTPGQRKTVLEQFSFWEAGKDSTTVVANRRNILIEPGSDENPATGFTLSAAIADPADAESLEPGASVAVSVRYQNRGTREIRDVAVRLKAPSALLTDLQPKNLAWDSRTVPALASVKAGEGGILTASFRIRPAIRPEDLGGEKSALITLSARSDYFLGDDRVRVLRTNSSRIAVPIKTVLGLDAAAFYFSPDGDQIGRGPLPPRVGETTKYTIVLHVTNTTGPVRDALLEAVLPEGVEWTGQTSVSAGSTLDYLPLSRGVRWQIGLLPAFADGLWPRVGASFEIALTPRAGDIGKIAALLSRIRLTGVDTAAGAKVYASAGDVTTELIFDSAALGRAKVVK